MSLEQTAPGSRSAEAGFREFYAELYGYLRRRAAGEDDARDLTQTVFLKLLQAKGPVRNLRAYLYQIARNTLSEYRQAALRDESGLAALQANAVPSNTETTSHERDEDFEWSRVDGRLAGCLRAFAERLAPAYREAVITVDFEAVSQKDFARRINRSYSSVRSRVQEGRRRLRGEFLRCCEVRLDGAGAADLHGREDGGCKQSCSCS